MNPISQIDATVAETQDWEKSGRMRYIHVAAERGLLLLIWKEICVKGGRRKWLRVRWDRAWFKAAGTSGAVDGGKNKDRQARFQAMCDSNIHQ